MNIIKVSDYNEEFDGSVVNCESIMMLDDNWGFYCNENGYFMIKNYEGDDEYIMKVVSDIIVDGEEIVVESEGGDKWVFKV